MNTGEFAMSTDRRSGLALASHEPASRTPADPLKDARIVWHMKDLIGTEDNPLTLQANGQVEVGQPLEPDACAESRKRGGDGYAALFRGNGWLSLDINRTNALQLAGGPISLYVRAWIGPDAMGCLFFSDFLALALHPGGLVIGFLGVKTPQGKVFRELPLCMIEKGGWQDLIVRVGGGKLDLFSNGVLRSSIPIHQELDSPFDSALAIGAFIWDGTNYDFSSIGGVHNVLNGFQDGKIDTVALWARALPDEPIAILSGVDRLRASVQSPVDRAIMDYNAFFDASVNKDLAECARLWNLLREFTDQDPCRPIYHLSPPVGLILDPAGAYYHDGKYHVFSYRNIFVSLRYCSLDHYVSDDLVHWTAWPIGPWADSSLDVYGIWMMNHFLDDHGVPNVIYTALGTQGKHGIRARSHDGLISFDDKQPVLTRYHHDGHVWKAGDTWYTITVKLTKATRSGCRGDGIMLWSSTDLEQWQEQGEIFTQPKIEDSTSEGDRAGFTEFPFLVSFGEKDVLILGSRPVRYWVGRLDLKQCKFIPDQPHGQLLDYANPFHCFNPLCVDRKGPGEAPRRIIMALYPAIISEVGGLPWYCVHAMPRALSLEGDHLRQDPLPEMKVLRGAHESKHDLTVRPETSGYIDTRGDAVEIMAEFIPGDARRFGLKVRVSEDGDSFIRIYFDATTCEFGVDGRVPDTHRELNLKPGEGAPSYLSQGQPVRMHAFLDKLLVEVFVNGQTATTSGLDRSAGYTGLDLFSEGGNARCLQLDVWEMTRSQP